MSARKKALIRAYRSGLDDWHILQDINKKEGNEDAVSHDRRNINCVRDRLRRMKKGTTAEIRQMQEAGLI